MMAHLRKQHIDKKTAIDASTFFKCIVCCMEYSDEFKLKKHLELSHCIIEIDNEEDCVV